MSERRSRQRWVRLLDELFLMRPGRRMSATRAVAYLALVAAVVAFTLGNELKQPPPFISDTHAQLSLDLAVNRAWCGTPSSVTSDPEVVAMLLDHQNSPDESIASILSKRFGSVGNYCARSSDPFLNNENSLMLTEAWLLRAAPWLSLNGLGRMLLALKLAGLLVLCFALLQGGAGVLMVAAVLDVGASLVFEVQTFGGFGIYGFLTGLSAAAIGTYGLGRGGHTVRTIAGSALAAGVATAFFANMRTSYLPLLVVLFGVYLVVALRPPGAAVLKRAAAAVLLFGAGYMSFQYAFILRGRPTNSSGFSYHVIAHPLVLSLAVPPNALATREGIEWLDGAGLKLARRVDPTAQYMGRGYESALFRYYVGLWRRYPTEMLQIYASKWTVAGTRIMQKARFTRSLLDAVLSPWRSVPSGFWFLALFALTTAAGGWMYVRTNATAFLVLVMTAITGLFALGEAAIIMPSFWLPYDQTLLFVCAVMTVFAAQTVVSASVAAAGWTLAHVPERQRGATQSLGEQTIADFGEQWTAYIDNSGFYGSPALLQDVFGPLLQVDELRGAVVADIGAGTGRFTSVFAASGAAKVVAVEPSRAFDVLVRNTADHSARIEYANAPGDYFRPSSPIDFAFSYGVLHHVPDPRPTVAAMRDALRPGGRIGIWVYGREGNEMYIAVQRVLGFITSRVPHKVLAAMVWALYWPVAVYMLACRWLPLPMRHYFTEVYGKLTADKQRLVLYDQLNPAYAKYYWQQEVRALLQDAGFVDIELFHRHGYSWTALAVKP